MFEAHFGSKICLSRPREVLFQMDGMVVTVEECDQSLELSSKYMLALCRCMMEGQMRDGRAIMDGRAIVDGRVLPSL
jgi:hypothetical protein